MIDRFEIVNNPSAEVWREIRDESLAGHYLVYWFIFSDNVDPILVTRDPKGGLTISRETEVELTLRLYREFMAWGSTQQEFNAGLPSQFSPLYQNPVAWLKVTRFIVEDSKQFLVESRELVQKEERAFSATEHKSWLYLRLMQVLGGDGG